MENITAPIKKNPVLAYFILTFTISWGGLFLGGGGVAGFPKSAEQFQAMMSFFIPVVLLGPSLSCLILTWLIWRDVESAVAEERISSEGGFSCSRRPAFDIISGSPIRSAARLHPVRRGSGGWPVCAH